LFKRFVDWCFILPKFLYNFEQRITRFSQRWRTLRTAIRNANCRIQWIIESLNATCALCIIIQEHTSLSIAIIISTTIHGWRMKVYLTKAVLLNFGYEAFLTIRAPEVILKDTPLYGGLSLTKVLSHGTYLVFTSYLWWISIEKLLLIKQYAFVLVFWRYAPATLFTCGDWASEK